MSETAVIVWDDMPLEFRTEMGMKQIHYLMKQDVTGFLESIMTEQWQYNMLLQKDLSMKDLEELFKQIIDIITAAQS